ncbi:hypothetical protein [Pseudobacteriovorax antillogorgiicola]|uniref:DUF3108 domain-containing protein n=1 Tax=Pseudobacteriovorax antillogorgiicola TaxID=1513793 RepID=A0A1Y6CJG2_9BACT|nr:hypothetical protein [Pseudobacteriovorax antillogorgiicola]TCS46421.1 hypothetical protein EDD56_12485 [Pseudobacteriovorax antillogorgiicola]SMF68988.1 hypothetical protein SAMN06296036_12485 [Pseudobacteriovorax antillogorgiicola]
MKIALLIPCILVLLPSRSFASLTGQRVHFTIHAQDSQEKVYEGYEDIATTAGQLNKKAVYYDLKKQEVMREEVTYNYKDLTLLYYNYENLLTGETTLVKNDSGTLNIRYRPGKDQKEKTGELKWQSDFIHGKSFHELIVREFAKLEQGESLKFALALPYRFETIDFRIAPEGRASDKDGTILKLSLAPQSFFIRQFAPKMSFTYRPGSPPKILTYSGPTGLPIDGEKGQQVIVKFNY